MPLAQINIGRLVADVEDPKVADFMNNLDRINALAERSDGFIWRLQSEEGNATAFKIANDPRLISNVTLWRDISSLHFFVFNTLHKAFFKRRGEWFESLNQPHFAMWYVHEGERPTLEDGLMRLEELKNKGETVNAFTWASVREGEFVKTT